MGVKVIQNCEKHSVDLNLLLALQQNANDFFFLEKGIRKRTETDQIINHVLFSINYKI